MVRITTKSNRRAGFTLIELAIVLAITALLTAGLWRMMSSGNTQLRDQAAADQHRDLISAVRGYLASSNGSGQLTALASGFTISLDCTAPHATFCNFRPMGMSSATRNSYDQAYEIKVIKTPTGAGAVPTSYAFMIKTTGGDTIPDTSGGRISSMIGNDGGFIYNANVCDVAGVKYACGAFGSWSANPALAAPAGYGFVGVTAGHVASRTFVGMNSSLNAPWLARLDVDGDAPFVAGGLGDYNTVQTDLSLGGKVLYGGTTTAGVGGEIENLKRLHVIKSLAGDLDASIEAFGCIPSAPGDAACTDTVTITGGVGITGHLKATNLYAGSFIYDTSDIRKKHDVMQIKNVLEKFGQLNGYSYIMNGGKETKYGVIAQEVEKVFPEVVTTDSEGYKSVDYMGLIGPLVEAVKELRKENDVLRKDIDALKARVPHK